jgi:uncharacterized protein YkuJ
MTCHEFVMALLNQVNIMATDDENDKRYHELETLRVHVVKYTYWNSHVL